MFFLSALKAGRLSLVVPTTNALTLVFTLLTGRLLGEQVTKPWRSALGVTLVMVGISLCVSAV